MSSKNPFDDDKNEKSTQNMASSSNNHNSSTNPFDDEVSSFNQGEITADEDEDEDAPAEASWQYLGTLPYRRIPIYSNVQWHKEHNSGLDLYPEMGTSSSSPSHATATATTTPAVNETVSSAQWRQSTFATSVQGCPHGGPLAVVTLPIAQQHSHYISTTLRILTNAGVLLAELPLPPPELATLEHTQHKHYMAAQIKVAAFTSQTCLVIVFSDSLCLVYDLHGHMLWEPFYIAKNASLEVTQAVLYEEGVALLTKDQQVFLCELFCDQPVPPDYTSGTPITTTTRTVASTYRPNHTAIVTLLPTAEHAQRNFCSYATLAVLPRHRTTHQHPEVFCSTSDHSVVVACPVQNTSPDSLSTASNIYTPTITDLDCRARITSPIVVLRFSPNGRFLACYTQAQQLIVVSSMLDTKVLEFDTSQVGSTKPPAAMEWCGEDSVVVHWKNGGVLMVGPYGDWLRFPFKGRVYLCAEMDCCRVISESSVELLQRVPPATAQLLRIGSIDTAALLLDASDAFHKGKTDVTSATPERGILNYTDSGGSNEEELCQAMETCLEAAANEFDIRTQKRLLRAASYGMHFLYQSSGGSGAGSTPEIPVLLGGGTRPSPTAQHFVNACRELRLLNALRNPRVGFIATHTQLQAMTPTGVVARLIALQRPALACSISKYMELPQSVQLYCRASKAAALVQAADPSWSDSRVAEEAVQVVTGTVATTTGHANRSSTSQGTMHRGAFATVAKAAATKRPGVARLLLLKETSVADKVPAMIATGEYAGAIDAATSHRDGDLIFQTLLDYEASVKGEDVSKAQAAFLGTVVSKFTPEAFHTLRRYLQTTTDVKSAVNLLLRAQRFATAGQCMAQRAMEEQDLREKQGLLVEASRIFGLGKETAFHKTSTDDYLELLRDQELLRTKHGAHEVAPPSSSVTATIASVIKHAAINLREAKKLLDDAEKIHKKYRIPEKRFWYIKVKALADSDQWSTLRIFCDSRSKSPIGYKPFARAAIRGKQSSSEVMKYIERVTDSEERYDLFCEANLWKRALEEAVKLRDSRRVLNVKTLCNSQEIQLMADEMLGRLA